MAHPDPDRQLLLGLLALQLDFVGADALVSAVTVWARDKSRPLPQILQEGGHLDDSRRALLDALTGAHLESHGRDPARSIAALSLPDSTRAALAAAGLANTASKPGTVAGDGTVVQVSPPSESPGVPSAVDQPRYRILRPHAKGGLGQVFVAEDTELKREVALKEIQRHRADDSDSRNRFVQEAEITGALEHPGVVPVYGLGRYPDGRPFYAMRFVRGDSLQDAVERFHGPPSPPFTKGGL